MDNDWKYIFSFLWYQGRDLGEPFRTKVMCHLQAMSFLCIRFFQRHIEPYQVRLYND